MCGVVDIVSVRTDGVCGVVDIVSVRAVMGCVVLWTFLQYKKTVTRVIGPAVGRWLLMITASQFHFFFYMSRPLPNIFALALG